VCRRRKSISHSWHSTIILEYDEEIIKEVFGGALPAIPGIIAMSLKVAIYGVVPMKLNFSDVENVSAP